MLLTREELYGVTGGTWTSAAISAVVAAARLALDAGRAIGTAIGMAIRGRKC